jgi:hypothetical protein
MRRAVAVILVIIAGCGGDSTSETTQGSVTSSTTPPPNVVDADRFGQDERIPCLLSEDAGTEQIAIGLLDAALPPWWATLDVTAPTQSNETLEALLVEAVDSPETAIKKAALADAGGNSIASTLGQVLVEAEAFAAGGCVLASGSATAALFPEAEGAGFSMTYLAYKAGEAYELAGLSDAAVAWYGVAATNPGNDPAGEFYADQAAEHLP